MWYVVVSLITYNAVDRAFDDAIIIDFINLPKRIVGKIKKNVVLDKP